jgi:predicted ATPase
LLQPSELQPSTIIIDEPELGLHPYAIKVLAALIRSTAKDKQIIVSTQSVELLNEFDPEDVVVVDRKDNASFFRRLGNDEFADWLEDYTLGELWQKNILGGRPAR